ncbi:unnamed protein product [Moneuplotes crassus]|uniref:Uncharacterized protein n=1 Tax=Euplotes crassus TaxID=5936 RepID=A0AAD1XN18_EUPCR|nr:unnamed protein product [Moneuplotes crassus]
MIKIFGLYSRLKISFWSKSWLIFEQFPRNDKGTTEEREKVAM